MDDEPRKTLLYRELLKREILRAEPRPRFVLFLDMLGFSRLTEDHPNRIVYDFESSGSVVSGTSESADRLGRFQHVLNTVPADQLDGLAPSHLMLFSDCAFLVFETALKAALSATALMRRFFYLEVPVRMGLAFGTWNADRFSFDSFNGMTVTRAVFYGTGVVRAHEAEKNSGKGLRVFLHTSVVGGDLQSISDAALLLPLDAAAAGPRELNYLHPDDGMTQTAAQKDDMLDKHLAQMLSTVPKSAPAEVLKQYTDTLAALNRMRQQWSRPAFSVPA